MSETIIPDIIHLSNIEYTYPQGRTLQFEDLLVSQGQHQLILGDSGSGKTTLLHILSGLRKPHLGEVSIANKSIYDLSTRALDKFRGQHIGLIFQDAHLIKSLTIAENLKIAQHFAGNATDIQRIREVLDWLNVGDKLHTYPQKLSRGQLQRVAIARAVVNHPSVLVADEPTASLDDRNTDQVIELLLRQAEHNNATLIVATHDKRLKAAIKNEYIVNPLHVSYTTDKL